jgi:membrane-bound serine protease (ClpP class)
VEAFIIIAAIGLGLLLAELLLPTGGLLAGIGAAGLVAAGVVAIGSDSDVADYVGGALIAVGIVCAVGFLFVARKVLEAHRQPRVRTGTEELLGADGEARSPIDPTGRVWLEGTIWSARLTDAAAPVRTGDRVTVEAVDGLTLVVRPAPHPAGQLEEGAG